MKKKLPFVKVYGCIYKWIQRLWFLLGGNLEFQIFEHWSRNAFKLERWKFGRYWQSSRDWDRRTKIETKIKHEKRNDNFFTWLINFSFAENGRRRGNELLCWEFWIRVEGVKGIFGLLINYMGWLIIWING